MSDQKKPLTYDLPAPVIEWPKQGVVHSGRYVRFAGTCLQDAEVELSINATWHKVPSIGTNWSFTLAEVGPGSKSIKVRQTLGGVVSDPGPERQLLVRGPSQTPAPEVIEPTDDSFIDVGVGMLFKGKHLPGSTVFIRDVDENLLGEASVDGDFWYFYHKWDDSRVAYVSITQMLADGLSDPVQRWVGVGLTNKKLQVTITSPEDATKFRLGDYIELEGTCTPTSNTGSFTQAWDFGGPPICLGHVVGNLWKVRYGPLTKLGFNKVNVRVLDRAESDIRGERYDFRYIVEA
ncbi:hypothetical protein D3C85_915090 [compost metagenome]